MIEVTSKFIGRHKLSFAIAIAIAIALFLTSVSMTLYVRSGTASLDLSRPGYKDLRSEVEQKPAAEEVFAPTGSLDREALDSFQSQYDAKRERLQQLGRYDDQALTDESMRLQ